MTAGRTIPPGEQNDDSQKREMLSEKRGKLLSAGITLRSALYTGYQDLSLFDALRLSVIGQTPMSDEDKRKLTELTKKDPSLSKAVDDYTESYDDFVWHGGERNYSDQQS